MLFAFVLGDRGVARLAPFRLYGHEPDRRRICHQAGFGRRRALSDDVESLASFPPASGIEAWRSHSEPFPHLAGRHNWNSRSLPDKLLPARGDDLRLRSGSAAPIPVYGHGVSLYAAFFVAAIVALVISTWRDLRSTSGGEHAELAFILIGGLAALTFTLLFSFTLGRLHRSNALLWFAPFRVIFFSLVVAYGIATRKIMEVGLFFRRAISYALLTGYLLALYGLVWWLVFGVFDSQLPNEATSLAHVVAAIVVAFAMAPARGVSQSLADKLFLGTRRLDFRSTMNEAAAILKSVTTLQDLLERFAKTIAGAVATDTVFILLPDHNAFAQHYPHPTARTSRSSLGVESRTTRLSNTWKLTGKPSSSMSCIACGKRRNWKRSRNRWGLSKSRWRWASLPGNTSPASCYSDRGFRDEFMGASNRMRSRCSAGSWPSRSTMHNCLRKCKTRKSITRSFCKTSPPA